MFKLFKRETIDEARVMDPTPVIEDRLKKITDNVLEYAESVGGEKEPGLRPFDCYVDHNGEVRIVFKDGSCLNDMLPADVRICDAPGTGELAGVVLEYDQKSPKNEIIVVRIDIDWVKNSGGFGVHVLAHELGHCLHLSKENVAIKRNARPYPSKIKSTKGIMSLKELEDRVDFAIEKINEKIVLEVEAGNYGIAIAAIFGLEDVSFMDGQNESVTLHYENMISQGVWPTLEDDIENLVGLYEEGVKKPLTSTRKFRVFDPYVQQCVLMSISELREYLKKRRKKEMRLERK